MLTLSSAWSKQYYPLALITWPNKLAYCQKHDFSHNYHLHPPNCNIVWDRPKGWYQCLAVLDEREWMLFTGCDSIITNPQRNIENFLTDNDDYDAILGVDHNIVFSDVMFLRNTARMRSMLQWLFKEAPKLTFLNEQEAITAYLHNNSLTSYQQKVGDAWWTEPFLHQSELALNNTGIKVKLIRPDDLLCGDLHSIHPPEVVDIECAWTPKHFILHMGGKSLEYRLSELPKYLPK